MLQTILIQTNAPTPSGRGKLRRRTPTLACQVKTACWLALAQRRHFPAAKNATRRRAELYFPGRFGALEPPAGLLETTTAVTFVGPRLAAFFSSARASSKAYIIVSFPSNDVIVALEASDPVKILRSSRRLFIEVCGPRSAYRLLTCLLSRRPIAEPAPEGEGRPSRGITRMS